MCDTICVMGRHTLSGAAMLAKNSDREPNEPHVITFIPAKAHAKGATQKCTYIEIPQAQRTNAVLLFKPDWIWGAEMGVNEYGVAIGNEAVFTKAKNSKEALTGMDLLRLALERADSAQAALDTIINLLKEFGQGGNCGYSKDFRYDNSFLIADSKSAFILETSGKNYAAIPVADKAAISNRLFMHAEHTLREGAPMTIWATGASVPCISAFKPVFLGLHQEPVFEDEKEGREYWLRHEHLHRAVLAGLVDVNALQARRDALEEKWLAEEERLFSGGIPDMERLKGFAARAAAEEQAMVDEFSREDWDAMKGKNRFARYWQEKNAKLGK